MSICTQDSFADFFEDMKTTSDKAASVGHIHPNYIAAKHRSQGLMVVEGDYCYYSVTATLLRTSYENYCNDNEKEIIAVFKFGFSTRTIHYLLDYFNINTKVFDNGSGSDFGKSRVIGIGKAPAPPPEHATKKGDGPSSSYLDTLTKQLYPALK